MSVLQGASVKHEPQKRERKRNAWLQKANDAVREYRFKHVQDWTVNSYGHDYEPSKERIIAAVKEPQYRRVKQSQHNPQGKQIKENVLHYYLNSAEYESVNDFRRGYGVLPLLLDYSQRYREEVEDKAVVLRNTTDNRLKILPYYTRFSADYYPSKYSELARLKRVADTGIFLTLTLDPKRFFCLKDAYTALMQGWNRLKTYILKHDRNPLNSEQDEIARDWAGDYIAVVEFQSKRTKLPHLHILMINCDWLDWNRVYKHWSKWTGGRQIKMEKIKREWRVNKVTGERYLQTPIDYILKYMKKAADNLEHLTELWALNARAYNVSRRVGEFIFNRTDEHFKLGENSIIDLFRFLDGAYWEYVGTFPLKEVENLKTYDELQAKLYG